MFLGKLVATSLNRVTTPVARKWHRLAHIRFLYIRQYGNPNPDPRPLSLMHIQSPQTPFSPEPSKLILLSPVRHSFPLLPAPGFYVMPDYNHGHANSHWTFIHFMSSSSHVASFECVKSNLRMVIELPKTNYQEAEPVFWFSLSVATTWPLHHCTIFRRFRKCTSYRLSISNGDNSIAMNTVFYIIFNVRTITLFCVYM